MSQKTFLWHDYETFGINFRYDLPAQFAAVRTDEDLNIFDETLIYCQPSPDYVPSPTAIFVTGITPQIAMQKGLTEAEFAKQINSLMSQSNTCIVGYNSIRFDDHISRHLFYRNFYDPYAHEYANGNSRWDLLDVMRTAYALRPNGINWAYREDGTPSFKLEDLTLANNIEENQQAHDALADTKATVKLAKLLKENQPNLFDYLFKMRGKQQVASQVEVGKPILHISGMYPAKNGSAALVVPITPVTQNACIVFNLSQDPDILLNSSQDELKHLLFTKTEDLQAENLQRVDLKQLWINKAPIVLPVNSLTPKIAERLNISIAECEQNFKKLKPYINAQLSNKVLQAMQGEFSEASEDAQVALYSGKFFDPQDKRSIAQVRNTPLDDLANLHPKFNDARLDELFFAYKAKNAPHILTPQENQLWAEKCFKRINDESLPFNLKKAEAEFLALSASANFEQKQLLEEYKLYLESIIPVVG